MATDGPNIQAILWRLEELQRQTADLPQVRTEIAVVKSQIKDVQRDVDVLNRLLEQSRADRQTLHQELERIRSEKSGGQQSLKGLYYVITGLVAFSAIVGWLVALGNSGTVSP